MKNLLMTLLFLCGLAATQAEAQTCCTPCPPGCCIQTCNGGEKSAAVSKKPGKAETSAVCTPAQLEACKAAKISCAPGQSAQPADAASANSQSASTEEIPAQQTQKQPAKKVALLREE